MNTEQEAIYKWREHVSTNEKFNNIFLKTFVGELVEYMKDMINQDEINIMYDFIEKRKSFTNKTKGIIISYMKKIQYSQDNELELKKKFKLYVDLGSYTREKITNGVRKQLQKINDIRKQDKQLIEKEQSNKEKEEKQKSDMAKLEKENSRLSNELDVFKFKNEKYKHDLKNSKEEINKLTDKNYNLLHEQNEELKYSREKNRIISEKDKIISEKDLYIQQLLNETKVLKMQLNHSHNQ